MPTSFPVEEKRSRLVQCRLASPLLASLPPIPVLSSALIRSSLPRRRKSLLRSRALLAPLALLLVASVGLPPAASAAQLTWKPEAVNLMVQDKPLPDVLRELFASLGQPVVISDRVRGNVTGRFNAPAEEFFNNLASVFGLMSYYDGSVLYISTGSEATSRVIPLRGVTPDRFRRTLAEMDVLDRRYELTIQDSERLVKASGPPRYVEVVEEIASKLEQTANRSRAQSARVPSPADSARPLGSAFRVFKLQYAWAQDTTMAVGGREVVVPGVATTLRRLVGNYSSSRNDNAGGIVGTAQRVSGPNTLARLRGTGLAAEGAGMRSSGSGGLVEVEPVVDQSATVLGAISGMGMVNVSLPRVEADARTNAIIVHDLPERLGRYADLIAELDVRPRLIQIDATIVDVSTNSVSRLGVDFSQGSHNVVIGRGRGVDADAQFRQGAINLSGQVANSAVNTSIDAATGAILGGPIGGMTSVVGNMGRYFLAQVNLLAQEGEAYVHARPGVLTTSNTEAVLENTQTFFVRVAGERDVDLFNVTSGTILRVTPVLVDEGGQRRIKMAVRIEDGSITGQFVDQIPIIQRSTVGTQAMISEGQSLLIGGYSYDVNRDLTNKVPILGDIPALGALFTFRNRQVSRVERMFMISPRIVEP